VAVNFVDEPIHVRHERVSHRRARAEAERVWQRQQRRGGRVRVDGEGRHVRASDAQRRRGGGGRQRGGEVGGLVEAVHLKLHYQRRPRGIPLAYQQPDVGRRGRKLA